MYIVIHLYIDLKCDITLWYQPLVPKENSFWTIRKNGMYLFTICENWMLTYSWRQGFFRHFMFAQSRL